MPGAILFDLLNGGDKDWGRFPPYRELGYEAAASAALDFALGSAGAGLRRDHRQPQGRRRFGFRDRRDGLTVGAIVAVNAAGSVTVGDGPWFWAAPFERDGEFGGCGFPSPVPPDALAPLTKGSAAHEHDARHRGAPMRR